MGFGVVVVVADTWYDVVQAAAAAGGVLFISRDQFCYDLYIAREHDTRLLLYRNIHRWQNTKISDQEKNTHTHSSG